MFGWFGVFWAAAGVCGMLLYAIVRLAPKAWTAYSMGLSPMQWAITAGFIVFMAYTEGYRGFQQKFSPRTAARVRFLKNRPTALRVIFAPLFAMGYFQATKRVKALAYGVFFGVTILVIAIQWLNQPWRGIVDIGVIVGLSWGLLSLLYFIGLAVTRERFDISPEVPD